MQTYKRMYLVLFHAVTDALSLLPEHHPAAEVLRRGQQTAEEIYIDEGEDE